MKSKITGRMDRKKALTQKAIIETSVRLFNQFGLESVTMDQIAEEVDIARGTLYNHFPSKELIINAYLQHTFQERNEDRLAELRKLPDTRSRLIQMLKFLTAGVQAQKEIFEAFMVYRMKQVVSFHPVNDAPSGLSNLVREVILLGQANHELRSDLSVDLLEDMFEFILIESIKPFYLEPDRYNAEEAIDQCVDLFFNGAKA